MKNFFLLSCSFALAFGAQAAMADTVNTYDCKLKYTQINLQALVTDKDSTVEDNYSFSFTDEVKTPGNLNIQKFDTILPNSQEEVKFTIIDMEHSCVDPADCSNPEWKGLFYVKAFVWPVATAANPSPDADQFFSMAFTRGQQTIDLFVDAGLKPKDVLLSLNCKRK